MNVEQSIEPGRKTFFSFRWRFFIRFTFSCSGKTQFDQLLSRLAAQKLWTDSWSFRKKCCKAIFKLVFIRHHCFSIIDFSFHYFSVYRQQLLHSQFHSSISAFFTIDIMQFINSFSIPLNYFFSEHHVVVANWSNRTSRKKFVADSCINDPSVEQIHSKFYVLNEVVCCEHHTLDSNK